MSGSYDYNIIDVVKCLSLEVRHMNKADWDVDCPFCTVNPVNGHNGKGKLNICIPKDAFRCSRCDTHGGMLDLYTLVKGVDRKQARQEILDYINHGIATDTHNICAKAQAEYNKRCKNRASAQEVDRTYRAFLSLCVLEKQHKEQLLQRGLSEAQIKYFGFRTAPTHKEQHTRIINKLLFYGYKLEGVPGFFKDKSGRWNYNLFRFTSGILIPMMSIDRKIQGFQIRLDNPREGNKYLWFSSKNKAQGLSSGSPAHITNPLESNSNPVIYLTEGGLKADIACALSGKSFIGVAGVNNQSDLPELFRNLKQLGVNRIVDCFDRDCEYNEQVEKARRKLKIKVSKAGLIYTRMSWDNRYKGIDDYMAAHEKREWKFSVKE